MALTNFVSEPYLTGTMKTTAWKPDGLELASTIARSMKALPSPVQRLFNSPLSQWLHSSSQVHKCGYIFWELFVGPLELVVMLWKPGATSEAHDHRYTKNWLMCLAGEVSVLSYHYSRNQRFLESEELLCKGNVSHTPAWATHEVINRSSDWAATLHVYWPRRI